MVIDTKKLILFFIPTIINIYGYSDQLHYPLLHYYPKPIYFDQSMSYHYPNDLHPVKTLWRQIYTGVPRLITDFFCPTNFAILAASLPFYFGARMFDKPIHYLHYCPLHHHNIEEFGDDIKSAVDPGIEYFTASIAGIGFLPIEKKLQTTCRAVALTIPFAECSKWLLRSIKWNGGKRPLNEHYSKTKRYYNGFPSGHMMMTCLLTTLFTAEFGPKAFVPFSIITIMTATELLHDNRHYLSQMVAGSALGVAFGWAAHTVTEFLLDQDRCSISGGFDDKTRPQLSINMTY
jgi:membrane-associated phospholipid phosphatase